MRLSQHAPYPETVFLRSIKSETLNEAFPFKAMPVFFFLNELEWNVFKFLLASVFERIHENDWSNRVVWPKLTWLSKLSRAQPYLISQWRQSRAVGEGPLSTQRPPVLGFSTLGSAGSLLPHWPGVWEQPYWLPSLLSCSWDWADHHSKERSHFQQHRPFCGSDMAAWKSWTVNTTWGIHKHKNLVGLTFKK